ncbi:unnamed protein product [marine sediment metagenome]|uniref:VanZ-like domain-containing protein n=1 Tax=marine sediment metagenome TaxID=412755 RepID=X0WPG9_9ZZZZ
MKYITKFKLLIFLLIPICLNAQIENIPQDKVKHFIAGSIISGTTYTLSYKLQPDERFRLSMYTVTLTAFGKEIYDSYNGGEFSFTDIGCTLLIGCLTSIIIYKIHTRKKKTIYNEWLLSDEPLIEY